MPLRIVDKDSGFVAAISDTLAAFTPNFDGTHTGTTAFTGNVNANLGVNPANFDGQFTTSPDVTGTIAATLGDGSASFRDAPYNLGVIPARFGAVEFADSPITTSSTNVNNQTELNAAMVSGARITVNAGSYTSLSFPSNVSDIDVIATGRTFSGGINVDPQGASNTITRVRVTGGTFGAGLLMRQGGVSHVTLDNIRSNSGGWLVDDFGDPGGIPNHVTVMNSTIVTNQSGSYGYLGGISHLIVANCDIANSFATQAAMRFTSMDNVIVVDSRLFSSGNRIFRSHNGDLGLVIRCQLESPGANNLWLGLGGPFTGSISRFEYRDNSSYWPNSTINTPNAWQTDSDQAGGIDDVIFDSNIYYGPDSNSTGNPPTNFTDTNNIYPAYQSPPAFTGGADH